MAAKARQLLHIEYTVRGAAVSSDRVAVGGESAGGGRGGGGGGGRGEGEGVYLLRLKQPAAVILATSALPRVGSASEHLLIVMCCRFVVAWPQVTQRPVLAKWIVR